MNILLIEAGEISEEKLLKLSDDRAEYLLQVRKVKVGDRVPLGVINGAKGYGVVLSAGAKQVRLEVELGESQQQVSRISLLLALPRPQILKKVLSSSAMLGVDRIYLSGAERVEKSFFQSSMLRQDLLRNYLRLGLEQAALTRYPEVSISRSLGESFKHIQQINSQPQLNKIICDPLAEDSLVDWAKKNQPLQASHYIFAIGPEGGWSATERELFMAQGFSCITLGTKVLRVEVALVYLLGQLASIIDSKQ